MRVLVCDDFTFGVYFNCMNENNNKEITTSEIMEFLQGDLMGFLQEHMVTREEFESRFNVLDGKIDLLDIKLNKTKLDLIDAMDEKNAALRGDIVVLMRGEDKKVIALIEILKKKNLLNENEAQALLALPPFPQISL